MGFCGVLNLIYHVVLEVSKYSPLKLRFMEALSFGNKMEIITMMYSLSFKDYIKITFILTWFIRCFTLCLQPFSPTCLLLQASSRTRATSYLWFSHQKYAFEPSLPKSFQSSIKTQKWLLFCKVFPVIWLQSVGF